MAPHPANRKAVAISLSGSLAIREGTRSLGDRDLGGAGPAPPYVAERIVAGEVREVPIP